MKSLAITLLAIIALTGVVSAQTPADRSGTWAFQSHDYGNRQFAVTMSGVAIVNPGAAGRYEIRLVANELIVDRASGRSQLITARQHCNGESDGPQFSINCRMAEPLEGYEPDTFLLQDGDLDQMVGVLNSAASGQVTFTRVR